MVKPYANQLVIPPDEVEEKFYLGLNLMKPVEMLIGISDDRKSEWIARSISEGRTVVYTKADTSVWYNKFYKKLAGLNDIKNAVEEYAPVVLTGDSFLTVKSRFSFFKYFPRYRKHAVVWEQDLDEMLKLGYERPTLDEGFDDFTYFV